MSKKKQNGAKGVTPAGKVRKPRPRRSAATRRLGLARGKHPRSEMYSQAPILVKSQIKKGKFLWDLKNQ